MPGPLMHAVTGSDQMLLAFVDESRPALQHDHDVEVGDALVPAGTLRGRTVGPYKLRQHAPAGGGGDTKVAIQEKVAQTLAHPRRIAALYMRERIDSGFVQHQAGSLVASESCFRPSLPNAS